MTATPGLTIKEAAASLRDGSLTSTALTQEILDRAVALNPALGAYVEITAEAALEQAGAADAALAAGDDRGPLQGIPLAIKDIIAMKGAPTTANSRVLTPDWGAGTDAPVVARLRDAGSVFIGKSTTSEFALGLPDASKGFPMPHNPWNLEHTPAGSSSGTGVAVVGGPGAWWARHRHRRLGPQPRRGERPHRTEGDVRPGAEERRGPAGLQPGQHRPDGTQRLRLRRLARGDGRLRRRPIRTPRGSRCRRTPKLLDGSVDGLRIGAADPVLLRPRAARRADAGRRAHRGQATGRPRRGVHRGGARVRRGGEGREPHHPGRRGLRLPPRQPGEPLDRLRRAHPAGAGPRRVLQRGRPRPGEPVPACSSPAPWRSCSSTTT